MRVDDEHSAALAIDGDRADHTLQRVERQMRHGERHFDFEDVAERAETGVEQDVADLGDDCAPNDRSRAAAAARWSTAPSNGGAVAIEDE